MNWLGDWIRSNTTGARDAAPPPPPAPMDGWSGIGRMLRALVIGVVALGVLAGAGWYYYAHRSLDWAIVVVAGDWRAHDGKPSEGFDNARRDVAAELRDKGFKPEDIVQFSVRPERYPDTHPLTATVQNIGDTLNQLAQNTNQGCLVYFSSHGAPWGLVLGGSFMNPQALSEIVDGTCGQRPTVVIISACYSGIFVSALSGANRVVMTASRPDRTSFGCGQNFKYPYFDSCVVEILPGAHSFPELADRVRDCVATREAATGVNPPSEPQISIGAEAAAHMPTWN